MIVSVENSQNVPNSKENPFEVTHDHEQAYIQCADNYPAACSCGPSSQEGDEIAYEIKENRVILTNASPRPVGHPFVTFDEWLGEADRKAYARL